MTQRYIGGLIYNPPGGYSGYFDGSGDSLTTASNAAFAFGSGDFTIECWMNAQAKVQSFPCLYGNTVSFGSNYVALQFDHDSATRKFRFWVYNANSSSPILETSGTYSYGSWYHVAVTRSGSTFRMFIDGVQVATATYAGSIDGGSSQVAKIGGNASSSDDFNGYISNSRLVKGTAVYTSAFTPPNGPLQNITNTSLLTCRYPTFVDGSSNAFTITVNGNTTVSTQNPFPLTTLPNPAQGGAGNGIFSMSQYQSLKQQNLWPAIDPYFDYTTLLLHGNGTNGGQNNSFLDSGTANGGVGFSITRNGNTTQGTFSPFSQTGWSNYFDGSSNGYMRFADSGSVLDLPGDFTIEFWTYQIALATTNATVNLFFSVDTLDRMQMYQDGSNVGFWLNGSSLITSSTKAALNTWAHYAVVRSGSTVTMYLNGTSVGSATSSYSMSCTDLTIAAQDRRATSQGPAYHGCNAYISNFRIVKGTAVYTAAFTPPTAPLTAISGTSLLTCQSNRFADNSGNALVVTLGSTPSVQAFSPFAPTTAYSASTVGGSGYFDGTGDYLTLGGQSAFVFGTGDFTIEMFAYVTNTANTIFDLRPSTPSGAYITIYMTGGVIYYYANGANQINGGTLPLNQWVHIVASRVSSNTRLFINGAQVGSTYSDTTNYTTSGSRPIIGADGNVTGSTPMIGYLSSLRVVKGSGVTSVTVPTAPLTNITNTSLLCNFTNAAIIDNTAKNVLETVADAQISTTQSKFGGASLYFDGTGDYLSAADSPNFYFGSGDWTIEAWLYINTAKNYNGYFGKRQAGNFGLTLQVDSSGNLLISASTTGSSWALAGASLGSGYSTGAWMHVAVTRSGTTITGWRNGTSTGTQTLSGSIFPATGYIATIGSANDTNQEFNGYIDDFRITKGIARYTSNFTPQTSQWQDQ